MEWLWRQAGARLDRGQNFQQGSRSYPLGFRNEGKTNEEENCGIAERKVLDYMRELTEGEGADR